MYSLITACIIQPQFGIVYQRCYSMCVYQIVNTLNIVCGDRDCIYISNIWDTISNFVVALWIYFRFEIGCCQRNKICIWRCCSQASYSVSVCIAVDLTFLLLSFWFSSFECFFESSSIDDNLKQQLVVLLPPSSTTSTITKIVHIEGVCVCVCMCV